ncbi:MULTISPECIES: 2-amino-4-hydroxy-6-hydroxymethyldihydropteridine diphosphokinase [unclassified Oceanispirochaeta]|uniref:2-amino-4-hydroxy-6- hydroxymethyldihydropteridine diphosphokinase n=1 Tax=unclassified Oceanispirochaeta TaxID=2635722 RepID=UPI000E08F4F5|nr:MULTISPECIES: 2-amino-4-hydroxy-6-hydroxymethyldihydropteridine diphosphokinase [unclassified Oceanispirochaeta]MBF9018605.1 2-amino-4-hydroxy-6-hydroxymethyldihydropteridine diphosphokinase [Oceanispirochaeta sp. M2]NPD75036.1 2-amino-4-hydroxy-6-hydroxymethyldihydropteridine diphosphokinase [Oceanispirochaeta sp. M1]RDG29109.1 2-amino-4-hydroxy-6-hydroxymethyldihydropteridine diphosphokinase [Oceanispirochaeta sp. M1]
MNIYIGVGSNIEPEKNIICALKILLARNFRFSMISTHYRTEALGHKDNPSYINGIWKIDIPESDSGLDYETLNRILKETEQSCGRIRTTDRWASRTIDLDILLMKSYISEEILERDFIYIPLLEIDSELELPGYGRLKELVDQNKIFDMNPLSVFTESLRRMIDE